MIIITAFLLSMHFGFSKLKDFELAQPNVDFVIKTRSVSSLAPHPVTKGVYVTKHKESFIDLAVINSYKPQLVD